VSESKALMKLFTLEEANAMIPKLELAMATITRLGLALRREIEAVAGELDRQAKELSTDELLRIRPEMAGIVRELEQRVAEIEASGAQFKGFDLGLVDFPAQIDGQFGLLCWQFGEKMITHWHTLDGGFAARKPLPNAGGTFYLQ